MSVCSNLYDITISLCPNEIILPVLVYPVQKLQTISSNRICPVPLIPPRALRSPCLDCCWWRRARSCDPADKSYRVGLSRNTRWRGFIPLCKWVMNHELQITSTQPQIATDFQLYKCPQWVKIQDSWIMNHPTSNLSEDGHTIAANQPCKFEPDWPSHMGAYR